MDSYEKWIRKTEEELQEALEAAEEAGWHHLERDTLQARTYDRIHTWLFEVTVRRERLDGRR